MRRRKPSWRPHREQQPEFSWGMTWEGLEALKEDVKEKGKSVDASKRRQRTHMKSTDKRTDNGYTERCGGRTKGYPSLSYYTWRAPCTHNPHNATTCLFLLLESRNPSSLQSPPNHSTPRYRFDSPSQARSRATPAPDTHHPNHNSRSDPLWKRSVDTEDDGRFAFAPFGSTARSAGWSGDDRTLRHGNDRTLRQTRGAVCHRCSRRGDGPPRL